MEVLIKQCKNCFHRAIESAEKKNGKDRSYCVIKDKIIKKITGVKCDNYKEENIWKE